MKGLDLPKLARIVVVEGEHYTIEYAVMADQSRPAETYLHALKSKLWEGDVEAESLPDDAQLSQYHRLLDACRHLAAEGAPRTRNEVNALRDGIWEFRAYNKRLSWHDTSGNGTFDAKAMIYDRDQSPCPADDAWWFPMFDEFIRLGHGFAKSEQETLEDDIQMTTRIRREDLAHDRP
jgi:hypothetical protein